MLSNFQLHLPVFYLLSAVVCDITVSIYCFDWNVAS